MLIKPDYNLDSIFDIDFDELEAKGIKIILSDLDSTVMPPKSAKFPDDVFMWISELKNRFDFAIVTNNNNKSYIDAVKTQCNYDIIYDAKKPSTKAIEEYLKEKDIKPDSAVMLGDRPLTDILAGKKLGMTTILVDSIIKDKEKPIVRFVRKLERLSIKK